VIAKVIQINDLEDGLLEIVKFMLIGLTYNNKRLKSKPQSTQKSRIRTSTPSRPHAENIF
jgi:hypothetical protein